MRALRGVDPAYVVEDSGSSKAAPPLRDEPEAALYAPVRNSGSSKAAPPLRVQALEADPFLTTDSGSSKAAPPLRVRHHPLRPRPARQIRAALKLPLHCGNVPSWRRARGMLIRAALKLPLHCGCKDHPGEFLTVLDSGSSKAAPPLRGDSRPPRRCWAAYSGSSKAAPPLRGHRHLVE